MACWPRGKGLVLALPIALGCSSSCRPAVRAPESSQAPGALAVHTDAPFVGPRLAPATLESVRAWGSEPDGSSRGIVAGVRVIVRSDGAIRSATELLPNGPTDVATVPERMGGGFLFAVRKRLWKADEWLGPLKPIVATRDDAVKLFVGLDRVYAWQSGWLAAVDPRAGTLVDPGPIPASPAVTQVVALDAWRAAAIADLRGVVVTLDAGATWHSVSLPANPIRLADVAGSIAVGASDGSWWEVGSDGQAAPLENAQPPDVAERIPTPAQAQRAPLGAEPLAAAVADGWNLSDGSALVARDGSVFVVNLSDGSLETSLPGAYARGPSRCRGISLASSEQGPDAFGFVCGLPRGWTAVYRWDRPSRTMVELRSFSEPRQVLAFGNGALAVGGACAARSSLPDDELRRTWCIMRSDGRWQEVRAPGDTGRIVVLSDGRLVVVEPPRRGELSALRLLILEAGRTREVPVSIPSLPEGVADALRSGLWLDGFQERRQGVIAGWVDLAQSALGVEIVVDGKLRVGEFVRDSGAPIVSGRWGLGWTASRGGFETTDGGMTWRRLELPEPLGVGSERACGPIGCVLDGWIRVGWGGPVDSVVDTEPPTTGLGAFRAAPNLHLRCEGGFPAGSQSPVGRAAWGSERVEVAVDVLGDGRKLPRNTTVGRVRTWRESTDREREAWRWVVEWTSPWGGASDRKESSPSIAPWHDADAARRALGADGVRGLWTWVLVPSATPAQALLIRQSRADDGNTQVFSLEADQPPLGVVRSDRRPLGAFEDALRVGRRWIFATAQGSGQLSATVVWSIEEAVMRELTRIPRSVLSPRIPARLAKRSDGDAIGLVVEGQIDGATRLSTLWVVPVTLDTWEVGEPEQLAPTRLGGLAVDVCGLEDSGWVVETPYPGSVSVGVGPHASQLFSPLARLRVARSGVCIEALLGSLETRPDSASNSGVSRRPEGRIMQRAINVGVLSAGTSQSLRCWRSSP
ncbi:MAG: hypothetical protein ABTD50_03975 [Polyangiaceae bacterium]